MNLLYFRGGPRDGEVLKFDEDVKPPEVVLGGRRCNAMYLVNKSPYAEVWYAEYERTLTLPEATAPSDGTSS